MIGGVGLLLIIVGLFVARKGISKNLYLFAIVVMPLTHIAIIFSAFVSVAYVVMAGFIAYVVFRRSAYGRLAKIWGYELALLAFIFYLGLTLFWGGEWREPIKQFLSVMLAGILVLALRQGGLGPVQAITAKRYIVIIGAFIGLLGLFQIIGGEQFYPQSGQIEERLGSLSTTRLLMLQETGVRAIRGQGTFNNAGALGVFLLVPFCICIDELLRFRKLRYLPYLALVIVGIVSTFSRAAYILVILGTMLLVGFYLRRGWCWALFLVFVLGTATVAVMPEKYDLTIMKMFGDQSEDGLTSNIRYYYWQTALNLFWTSPITGLGYASSGTPGQTNIVGFDPHSSYLAILVNQGVIGLGLFVTCLIATYIGFKRVLRYDQYTLRPLFVAFQLYLISLMVDGLVMGEPFIYLMPTAFLAIYTSGRGPKSFESSPPFSSRRYSVAAQSGFNCRKPGFSDKHFPPATGKA